MKVVPEVAAVLPDSAAGSRGAPKARSVHFLRLEGGHQEPPCAPGASMEGCCSPPSPDLHWSPVSCCDKHHNPSATSGEEEFILLMDSRGASLPWRGRGTTARSRRGDRSNTKRSHLQPQAQSSVDRKQREALSSQSPPPGMLLLQQGHAS